MYKGICITALLAIAGCCGALSKGGEWLSYEPTTVTLAGTLEAERRFGPPNYGENPETDVKLDIPMLHLERSIRVRGNKRDDVNVKSFENIQKIQLIFLPSRAPYSTLVGQKVEVAGTLSQAITGRHFTDVVLTVQEIHRAKN
jgi:hypothetical protein